MGCLKYEFIKLWKKSTFCILAVLLLVGNLFAIYMSERMTTAFSLVYEHRDNYEAFLNGDASADINEFYSQDISAQELYISSYPEFINGMNDRIVKMSVFADTENYTYRNMQKTYHDFQKFSDISLKIDNCFGIRAFSQNQTGILFMLVFLAIITYYVVFYERDKNLLLLIKGTRRGHASTALSKAVVMILTAGIYTIVQELSTALLINYLYGYGDMGRAIQSSSEFRNCTYMLTVGEALAVTVLIRGFIAMLSACIFFCVAMNVKNEMTAAFMAAIIWGLFFFARKMFLLSGSLDWLVCINPFYCWDMRSMLGEYHNLNLAGYPFGKTICTVIVAVLCVFLMISAGIILYNTTYQIRSDSRIDWIVQKMRKRLGGINHRTSLLYYEFYKMLIQQKKIILIVLLVILGCRESASVFGTQYYASVDAVSYHFYMDQYQGRITDQILDKISEEEKYLNSISEELKYLNENSSGENTGKKTLLEIELYQKETGYYRVISQLESLEQKEGDLNDKYLIDELDYNDLWNNTQDDIIRWLLGAEFLILLISGVYTMDEKRKMVRLLRTTRFGREKLENSRVICAVLCTLFVYVCMELPVLFKYCRAGLLLTPECSLLDFTVRSFHTDITLGMFAVVLFVLKAAAYGMVCFAVLNVSKILKNEMPVLLICSGTVLAIAGILLRFSMDIEMILMYIL